MLQAVQEKSPTCATGVGSLSYAHVREGSQFSGAQPTYALSFSCKSIVSASLILATPLHTYSIARPNIHVQQKPSVLMRRISEHVTNFVLSLCS